MDTVQTPTAECEINQDGTIKVGNLGVFSMKAVYDALVGTFSGSVQPAIDSERSTGHESDCSWTGEEENGDFYIRMRRSLDAFALAADQSTMTTDMLSRHQRRFVHATAQVMDLGHASLGPRSKYRRMVVFKSHDATIPILVPSATPQRLDQIVYDENDSMSMISSTTSQRKRKRLERVEGGYACQFSPCNKVFDRASERNKHEQAHQPAFANRHLCTFCSKGFRYPKDVRRHVARVHENAASRPIFDPTYASLGSVSMTLSSTLTYESRIPSETSLHFNSNPTSKNTSPMLRRSPGQCSMSGIEPFSLNDATNMMPHLFLDEQFDLPFQELADFEFDQHDLGEDCGLEMPKIRK